MSSIVLKGRSRLAGVCRVPGSKSYSNRYLVLAALAEGTTEISGLPKSRDIEVMKGALQSLGISLHGGRLGPDGLSVQGCGGVWPASEGTLHLGNAGTAMRPLCAVLSLTCRRGGYVLRGDARMYERPIRDLVDALTAMGARISYERETGFPPLKISPGSVSERSIKVKGDISSQYLSSLLLAAPLTPEGLDVEIIGDLVSRPYVDLTMRAMNDFGVNVTTENYKHFNIPPGGYRAPSGPLQVEGDASAASYFLALGAIGGGPVRVENLVPTGSNQSDIKFADVIASMGATVEKGLTWIQASRGAEKLKAQELDLTDMPDAAMTVAALGAFAEGTTVIRGIGNWRVKETDRLVAMAKELRKVGADVKEGSDFIVITPPPAGFKPAVIDTYDDHRMAMCFSLMALGGVDIEINDPSCCAKTFPEYFDEYNRLS